MQDLLKCWMNIKGVLLFCCFLQEKLSGTVVPSLLSFCHPWDQPESSDFAECHPGLWHLRELLWSKNDCWCLGRPALHWTGECSELHLWKREEAAGCDWRGRVWHFHANFHHDEPLQNATGMNGDGEKSQVWMCPTQENVMTIQMSSPGNCLGT